MPQTFLTGLAAGLGGESMKNLSEMQVNRKQRNASDLIQRMETEKLVIHDFDGAKIDWEKFKNPEYKGLRQQLINSGGQALLKYFEKDGSIRQGSFDDMVEISKGEFAVGTKREDGKPGQVTDGASTGEEENVVITPERHLERISNVILGGVLQDYDPAYGAGLTLQREKNKRIDRDQQRMLSSNPDLKASQERLNLINGKIAELKEDLKVTVDAGVDENQDPADTRDAVVTINEELDTLEDEKVGIETDLGETQVPYGIPAMDLGPKISAELFELPKSSINQMKKVGMTDEQVQGQVTRHSDVMKKVENADFQGLWRAGDDRASVTRASLLVTAAISNKNRILNQGQSRKAQVLQERVNAGETLSNQEQRNLQKYQKDVKRLDDVIAKHQKTITETFVRQADGDYSKGNGLWQSVKSFLSELGTTNASLNKYEREHKHDAPAPAHSSKIKKLLEEEMALDEKDKENRLELENLMLMKEAEENNWNTMADFIKDLQKEKKFSVMMFSMSKREAQARGGGALDAFDNYKYLENIVLTGSPQVGPIELANQENERLKRQNEVNIAREKASNLGALNQLKEGKVVGELRSRLIAAAVDDDGNILPPNSKEFREVAAEIFNLQEIFNGINAQGGSPLTMSGVTPDGKLIPSPLANVVMETTKDTIGYAIATALEDSMPDFWDIFPGGDPGFSEFGRWWGAQNFYFSPLSILPIPTGTSSPVIPGIRAKPYKTSIGAANIGGMVDRSYAKFDSKGNLVSIHIHNGGSYGDKFLKLDRNQIQDIAGDKFSFYEDFYRQQAKEDRVKALKKLDAKNKKGQ